jgi:uncharacterized protein YlzI (FlbEa/FlbD family)
MTKLTDLMGRDVYIVDAWITRIGDIPSNESALTAKCKVWMSDGFLYVRETKEEVVQKLRAPNF